MWKPNAEADIYFTVADARFCALNLVYERFQRTIPSHSHGNGSYEIHYIPQGRGRALIDGAYHEIGPGTLYVTGPHVEHAQSPRMEDPMCEYCIYLKMERRRRGQKPLSPQEEAQENILDAFCNTPFWFGQDTQEAGALIEEIFTELAEGKTGYTLMLEAMFGQLLVRLVRNYEKGGSVRTTGRLPRPDKTSVIIEDYFLYQYRNLSLEELSSKLGLGTRQTERLLLKHYGKTFLQKKAEARMSAAAILLGDTNKSITAIAEELGYSSSEHFSSAFKHYYHISPRQYRKESAYHSFPERQERG